MGGWDGGSGHEGLLGQGEGDVEAQPGAGRAGGRVGEAQGAAVELGHPAGHGQAEAGAPSGGVGAEPLEDPLAVVGGHAGSAVHDLQPPVVVAGPGRHVHR